MFTPLSEDEFIVRHIRSILSRFDVNGVVLAPLEAIVDHFRSDTVINYYAKKPRSEGDPR